MIHFVVLSLTMVALTVALALYSEKSKTPQGIKTHEELFGDIDAWYEQAAKDEAERRAYQSFHRVAYVPGFYGGSN
jgi:hypothetical protein